MKKTFLDKGWTLLNNKIGSLPASVPGCVHTDLMASGHIKDLYWRDNSEKYLWIENENFTYRCTFDAEPNENATLCFDGLDTYCDVFLNGEKIGSADDMFIDYRFPVGGKLKEKDNLLEIVFRSPVKEVENEPLSPQFAFTGERIRTRRIQCTYGWDWVDRFVTMGIYRPVYIEYGDDLRVDSAYIVTENIDDFGAQIRVELDFLGYDGGAPVKVDILSPTGERVAGTTFYCREPKMVRRFDIENPLLWYPLGYGEHPIYTLRVMAGENEFTETFGIRQIKILQMPDKEGSEYFSLANERKCCIISSELIDRNKEYKGFQVIVNGKRIFCRGANWVPCEPFPSAETYEKYDKIISLAAQMNVNMIRVWGGGVFENKYFYDLCDKTGILVTQDFLMACGKYPEKEQWFIDKLLLEAEYAAKQLRNHPCLAWWSGDNENATFGDDDQTDYMGRDAALSGIAPLLYKLDSSRPFLPSSPYGGYPYASWTAGTTHNTNFVGQMYDYFCDQDCKDYKEYFSQFLARFIAEEPTFGAVSRRSALRFMTELDINDADETILRYHTKTNPALKNEVFDCTSRFALKVLGDAKDGEDRYFKYKYIQYEWVRIVFENLRRNIGYCNGLVFWMLDDCWPAALGWAFIDYYCMPKASYYAFRRCSADCMVSVIRSENKYNAVLSNCTNEKIKATGKAHLLNKNTMAVEDTYSFECEVEAYSPLSVELPFVATDEQIVVCDVDYGAGADRSFYKDGALDIAECTDKIKVIHNDDGTVTVEANEYVHIVELEGDGVFTDNYFSLLAGESKTVSFSSIEGNNDFTVVAYTLV